MVYRKPIRHFVGNSTKGNQVEEIGFKLVGGKAPVTFQSHLCHEADAATGTVFKDKARDLIGALDDMINLGK